MKKNARSVALSNGLPRYVSDRPCKRGHLGERMTLTGTCIECRKIKSREKYAADPEKKIAEAKARYAKNAESIKEKRRKKYAENPEKELVISRVRAAEWRAANPDKVKAQKPLKQAYKRANPHKSAALCAKRRSAKMLRTPNWLSNDDLWMIEQAYELAALRKKATGVAWHVDHVVPLQGQDVSGLHVPWNLQVIPWRQNLSKGNRTIAIEGVLS